MLIYLIPLVILVIVLLVLKKRQDAQESDKKTAVQKAKAKKASSSAKIAPNKTQPVQHTVIDKKQTTALSADIRSKIESLIQERNFFSAEAQINQALKKDNSQHDLYLYLLDIHILQKDEFAISQLLNHLRSLELNEVLQQAEARKAEYDQSQNNADEAIAFISPSLHAESAPVAQKQQNNADFDALMAGTAPTAEAKADLTFERIERAPQKVEFSAPTAPPADEIKPLDFNLSFDAPPKAEPPAPAALPSVDFGSFSLEETLPEVKVETPAAEIQPLDFSLNLAPEIKAKPESSVQEEIQPLNFSFSLDQAEPKETPKAPAALSFDLVSLETDILVQVEPEAVKPASTALSFDLSNVHSASVPAADSNDPLVQSFPELIEADEICVNLELAQQYIKLGSFDAARELLAEKEAEYSIEQRQQADLLLNQIAS